MLWLVCGPLLGLASLMFWAANTKVVLFNLVQIVTQPELALIIGISASALGGLFSLVIGLWLVRNRVATY